MKNNYWIKLYYELREDMKVFRLSDSAFRRFILLMLLAGENDRRDGTLPDIDDISFLLRVDTETLQSDLYELEQAGIVEMRSGVPFLVNFAKRQQAKTGAQRIAAYRERKRKQEYYGNDTEEKRNSNEPVTNRYIDKIRLDKIRLDKDTDAAAAPVVVVYENTFGTITPLAAELLQDDIEEYGADKVIKALTIAKENRARGYKYVEGILRNWNNGKTSPAGQQTDALENILSAISRFGRTNGAKAREALSDDEWALIQRMGGWYHLCAATPDKIQISYYSARKAANYAQ